MSRCSPWLDKPDGAESGTGRAITTDCWSAPLAAEADGEMGPRRVFVDTGAWYALQVSDDAWHRTAVATLEALVAAPHVLLTTNHVIAETYTLLRITCGHAPALRFLESLEETRRLERIFVSQAAEARADRLLRQYADQELSFVDATSFAVMRAERMRHAFAFDRHFATAGFARVAVDVPLAQL